MVITAPSTAATIPSPGRKSAMVERAVGGISARWWWTSMYSSIIWSTSNGSTPPLAAIRMVADEIERVMVLEELGYLFAFVLRSFSVLNLAICAGLDRTADAQRHS